jgi:glycosyltransferase involved in cell wall biosynthesis
MYLVLVCRRIQNTQSKDDAMFAKAMEETVYTDISASQGSLARGSAAKHVAFYLDHLGGGGVQKVWLILAGTLAQRGHQVDLLLCEAEGPLVAQVPNQVRVIELSPSPLVAAGRQFITAEPKGIDPFWGLLLVATKASGTLPFFPDLVRYLRSERPYALYAATPHMNLEAVRARKQADVPTRLIISDHNNLAEGHPLVSGMSRYYLPPLLRKAYRLSDAVVAVSDGVREDIAARTGLARNRIKTIYNPAVSPELHSQAEEPLDHPWFQPGAPPVILGVGRLGQAKDFPNLIRAFARVRQTRQARLVILGEAKNVRKTAKRRARLVELATELGVSEDLDIPGFAQNPYKYMRHAGVFVLSSRYEGLGNVLIEALASGCPVVSTDCPSGPSEILENGNYGPLVPVEDDAALAKAIESVLDNPLPRRLLRERADLFSVDQAVDQYEALLVARR